MLKSRLYLLALTKLDEIFRKGILSIDHRGPHHYFLCLLKLSNLTPLNALADVSTTPDDHFKEMLKQSGEEEVLAVDDGPDVVAAEVGELVAHGLVAIVPQAPPAVAPGVAPVLRPVSLGPTGFSFQCLTHTISIRLDGQSHQSRRRRCYCKCPWHDNCHKYVFLSSFDQPWEAFATVLMHMRVGALCITKGDHLSLPDASHAVLLSAYDEMPAVVFSAGFLLGLQV